MSVFGGDPSPCDLCLPGNHLADIQVDGAPIGDSYAVYVCRAAYAQLPARPVIPPAFRGTRDRPPAGLGKAASKLVWVVLALDPQQEKELLRGGGGIINRAIVHLLYEDGTVISHFEDPKDAHKLAAVMCEAVPERHDGPAPEI